MTDTATPQTHPTVIMAGTPDRSETEPFRLVRLYQDGDVIGIRLDDGTVKAFNMPGNIDVRRRVSAVLARLDIAATIRLDLILTWHRLYPYTVTGVIEVGR